MKDNPFGQTFWLGYDRASGRALGRWDVQTPRLYTTEKRARNAVKHFRETDEELDQRAVFKPVRLTVAE